MNVQYERKTQESDDVWTFYFLTDKPVRYVAGQFTELTIPHDKPDSRGIKRWFTLSSSPSDQYLSITTRIINDNGSSFKKALSVLEPGANLKMDEPMGDFVLPKDIRTPLVFVAGGIGVTPFHSIFTWIAASGEQRPIHFLYAVNREDQIIFQNTFAHADQHVSIVVSEPSREWGGLHGPIDADMIVEIGNPTPKTLIYLSGPEAMTETLVKELKKGGIANENIVTDYFPGYTQL
jgi:ferredoxin-NADP reductase